MTDSSTVQTKIKGGIATKKVKNATTRKSNFLLTVNTNQKYRDNDPAWEQDSAAFDETIGEILNDLPTYLKISDAWTPQHIHNVDIDYVVERGPNNGGLHAHILFKFEHSCTKLHLNYEAIKQKITQDLGLTNIYMLNKLVRPSGNEYLLNYIAKYR